jgi:hypothetical protein
MGMRTIAKLEMSIKLEIKIGEKGRGSADATIETTQTSG